MRPFLLQILFLFLCTQTFGQRLIGKTIYTFTKPYSIDTIAKGKNKKLTVKTDTIRDISTKAHSFSKVSSDEARYSDSIIKSDFYKAIVQRDSMEFIRNHVRTLGATYKPEDFSTYKLQRTDFYKRIQRDELKRLRKSDRYYSSFIRDGKNYYVILFDPFKLKKRLMGDIIWFDYLDALIIDPTSNTMYINGTLDWN
jgi:hypothetical protein